MFVYRTMSSEELINGLNGKSLETSSTYRGLNTFDYQKNISYIHFFKYLKHALCYMKQNNNPVVAKIDLPNSVIPNLEYGLYNGIDTYYDESLAGYYIPLPEYIIERNLFQKEYIVDFTHNGVWQDPLRKNESSSKPEFCTMKIVKNDTKEETLIQHWDEVDVYYEYIKKTMGEFNIFTEEERYSLDDMFDMAKHLKTINLEEELQEMEEYIRENQVITRRRAPRGN